MTPLTDALLRLRQVAYEHDERVGERSGFSADVTLVAEAVVYAAENIPEMLTLLRGFVHAGEGWALERLRKDTRMLLSKIDGQR